MPFDSTETGPSLKTLAIVLRDKSLWPVSFRWNFTYADTCAMGLAVRLWPQKGKIDPIEPVICEMFGIDPLYVMNMFFLHCEGCKEVLPEHIAQRIENYLAFEQKWADINAVMVEALRARRERVAVGL